MAKVDHLQQLKGRTLSGPERVTQQRHNRFVDIKRTVKHITPQQEKVLKNYITHETNFYNSLVESLYSRLKTTPEFFSQLTDEHMRLFGKLCRLRFDITKLMNKKSENFDLPEELIPFKNILFGIQGDKEVGLSDRLSVFFEVCADPSIVLPSVRENMALELLEFCIKQSPLYKQRNVNGDQEFKHSPEILEKVNTLQKRHLQIQKSNVRWKWSEEDDATKIWIPHLSDPIYVMSDLNEVPQNWNMIIVHQTPNTPPIGRNIPWEIDFKRTNSRYLIKYLESKNPIGQMKSRYLGLKL